MVLVAFVKQKSFVCSTRPCGLPLAKQEVLAFAKGHCHCQKLPGLWLGWDFQGGVNSVWGLGGVIGVVHQNVIALGEVTREMTCMLNRSCPSHRLGRRYGKTASP